MYARPHPPPPSDVVFIVIVIVLSVLLWSAVLRAVGRLAAGMWAVPQ